MGRPRDPGWNLTWQGYERCRSTRCAVRRFRRARRSSGWERQSAESQCWPVSPWHQADKDWPLDKPSPSPPIEFVSVKLKIHYFNHINRCINKPNFLFHAHKIWFWQNSYFKLLIGWCECGYVYVCVELLKQVEKQ